MPPLEQPATYPPLQPKNTLYSLSFHLDLASFWQHRDQLLPASAAKGLATFEKNSGRILGGVKISTLLESAGANHRFIVANQVKRPYQREPYVKLPAFAFVSQLREPERFGRAMETLLRTVGLFTTDTFKLELHEEQHAGRDIVAYRFKEKGEVRDDVNLLRYNFVPCFARAGNQFILCSNLELCRELLDLVQAEERKTPSPVPVKAWEYFSSKGLAGYLRDIDDQLITQTILDQATPPAEARKQVDDLIDFIAGLGSVRGSVRFQPKTFRYDLYLRLAK
jgi:hypothetical protein